MVITFFINAFFGQLAVFDLFPSLPIPKIHKLRECSKIHAYRVILVGMFRHMTPKTDNSQKLSQTALHFFIFE